MKSKPKLKDATPTFKAALPCAGFGTPRRWLQTIFTAAYEDGERFDGFNGDDEAIHQLCLRLIQSEAIAIILILSGTANLNAVKSTEILAEYRLDDTGKANQRIVYPG